MTLVTLSCVESGGKGSRRSGKKTTDLDQQGDTNGDGNGVGQADGGVTGAELEELPPKVELQHLIDPFDGTFVTKLTIPKNFSGFFHLSGLNISSLTDNLIKVRFKFGRGQEPITLDATPATASGLTPQTNIQVLTIDMRDQPFQNLRLLYDLFDYTKYGVTDPFVSDNRDRGLHCRGLRLEDDPTFVGSSGNSACDQPGEECLYTYAKIIDSGLVSPGGIAEIPSEMQIDLTGLGFNSDTNNNSLKKCLPDNNTLRGTNAGGIFKLDTAGAVIGFGSNALTSGGVTFVYNGPYRPISENSWDIGLANAFDDPAVVHPALGGTGIFRKSLNPIPLTTSPTFAVDIAVALEGGIQSYLFPLAGKIDLGANIDHIASTTTILDSTTARNVSTLLSGSKTDFMDGCNIRALFFDKVNSEGIGSCNVSATIEVITVDPTTKVETVISNTNSIKLQLVRPSLTNFLGEEVLFTSLKKCSSTKACGSGECCFNERCWSKNIVSQCLEDTNSEGSLSLGELCTTDYQCSSLCCDPSKARCGVHNGGLTPPVFCSKPPGSSCVAREFCRQENIRECFIVKTGTDTSGNTLCQLRCFNRLQHGTCQDGQCIAPSVPSVPFFDSSNPDCTSAVDLSSIKL